MLTTKKLILMLLSIFSVLVTIIFSIIFVNRLVMPYNSEGNYFDKGNAVVYNEQAVLVYGILLFIAIAVTAVLFVITFKENNKPIKKFRTEL